MINWFFFLMMSPTDTIGVASYYHNMFIGRKTASGEKFSQNKLTAASNFYDLGTKLRVTNLENDSSVVVTVNDRMGNKERVIDLTKEAARRLGFIRKGITKVKLEIVNEKPIEKSRWFKFSIFRLGFPL